LSRSCNVNIDGRTFLHNNERGFALVSVLVLSGMLFLVGSLLAARTRAYLALSGGCRERSAIELKLYSARNDLLMGLTTGRLLPYKILPGGNFQGQSWNLFGGEFSFENQVRVKLQDTAGLVSPFLQPIAFANLLVANGMSDSAIRKFQDALADWKDEDDLHHLNGAENFAYKADGHPEWPRNGFPQSLDELLLVRGLDRDAFAAIRPYLCYSKTRGLNYLTMSPEVLRASLPQLDGVMLADLLKSRESGNLTAKEFINATGIVRGENQSLFPNGLIAVELSLRTDRAAGRESFLVYIKGDRVHPYLIWEFRS